MIISDVLFVFPSLQKIRNCCILRVKLLFIIIINNILSSSSSSLLLFCTVCNKQFCFQYKDGEMCVRHGILCKTSLHSTCVYGNFNAWWWFLLFNTMLCKVQTWLSSLGDGLLQCQVTAFISGWEIQLLVISRRPSDQNCTRKSPPLTVGNCEPSNGVVRTLFYDVVLSITDNIQAWWCAY